MHATSSNGVLRRYEQLGVQQALDDKVRAHLLIDMLLRGGLERVAKARDHMRRGDNDKGVLISQAISILDGLRASLSLEAGGEIAFNLDNLYEYCQRRLLSANRSNDLAILDEVSSLLREISNAWDAISPVDGQVVSIFKENLCEQIHA